MISTFFKSRNYFSLYILYSISMTNWKWDSISLVSHNYKTWAMIKGKKSLNVILKKLSIVKHFFPQVSKKFNVFQILTDCSEDFTVSTECYGNGSLTNSPWPRVDKNSLSRTQPAANYQRVVGCSVDHWHRRCLF